MMENISSKAVSIERNALTAGGPSMAALNPQASHAALTARLNFMSKADSSSAVGLPITPLHYHDTEGKESLKSLKGSFSQNEAKRGSMGIRLKKSTMSVREKIKPDLVRQVSCLSSERQVKHNVSQPDSQNSINEVRVGQLRIPSHKNGAKSASNWQQKFGLYKPIKQGSMVKTSSVSIRAPTGGGGPLQPLEADRFMVSDSDDQHHESIYSSDSLERTPPQRMPTSEQIRPIAEVQELKATLSDRDSAQQCLLQLGNQTFKLEPSLIQALQALTTVPEAEEQNDQSQVLAVPPQEPEAQDDPKTSVDIEETKDVPRSASDKLSLSEPAAAQGPLPKPSVYELSNTSSSSFESSKKANSPQLATGTERMTVKESQRSPIDLLLPQGIQKTNSALTPASPDQRLKTIVQPVQPLSGKNSAKAKGDDHNQNDEDVYTDFIATPAAAACGAEGSLKPPSSGKKTLALTANPEAFRLSLTSPFQNNITDANRQSIPAFQNAETSKELSHINHQALSSGIDAMSSHLFFDSPEPRSPALPPVQESKKALDKLEDAKAEKPQEEEDEYALLIKQMQLEMDALPPVIPIKPPQIVTLPPLPIATTTITSLLAQQPTKLPSQKSGKSGKSPKSGKTRNSCTNNNHCGLPVCKTDDSQRSGQDSDHMPEHAKKKQEFAMEIIEDAGDALMHAQSMPFTPDEQTSDLTSALQADKRSSLLRKDLDDIILENLCESRDSESSQTPKSSSNLPSQLQGSAQSKATPNRRLARIDEERTPSDNMSQSQQTILDDDSVMTGQTFNGPRNRFLGESQWSDMMSAAGGGGGDKLGSFLVNDTSGLSYQIEAPRESGNVLIDKISQFAYSHGIDPRLFVEKDHVEAQKALNQIALQIGPAAAGGLPTQSRKDKTQRRGGVGLNQKGTVSFLLSQEVREIRAMLHESSQPLANQRLNRSAYQVTDTSFEAASKSARGGKDFLGVAGLHTKSTTSGKRRLSYQSMHQHSDGNVRQGLPAVQVQQALSVLHDETLKNKVQISVLSLALNRFLNNQDRQKVNQINRQVRILEQHDRKVKQIMHMFRVFKKELHFAFLFASPLVVQKSNNGFKYFPQLDFAKEFVKIRESITAAQLQINITRRQCTTDSIQEVLAQKPLGLHFSGHGLLNNLEMGSEFFNENKGQGDFLVLENDKGGSELVSREQLKKMIKQNKCELEFVFVATCHSEFVGRIFQQAGARHVICIKQSKEVRDDAVIAFTDTFYSMLFEQNKEVCTAFHQAQLSVEISFSQSEASIFQLLLSEDLEQDSTAKAKHNSSDSKKSDAVGPAADLTFRSSTLGGGGRRRNGKLHICTPFGPFQKGHYTFVNHQQIYLLNKAPRVPNLRGRQKDMYRVIDKVLNSKNSRLFTLTGWPGVGKSALIAKVLDYIAERGLLKGGSIFFNARNIAMCEVFIRNLNQVLIAENPTLFGMSRERDQLKQEPIKTLQSILAKIAIIDGDIVLVIDNAEELISNERGDFQMLLSMMLTRVSQLKIVLTSQRCLQHTKEFKEEKIILGNLSNIQSANLFKEVMSRNLEQDEINGLLRAKPDFGKYPDEQAKWEYKTIHEHHLFTLLNGNPQSIILVASLLADPQKRLTLAQVYRMLTDDQLFKLLAEEGIGESMLVSLRLSAQLSLQAIQETDPESMDLLYLLSLLPGGINPHDLDFLWGQVAHQNRKMQLEATAGVEGQRTSKLSNAVGNKGRPSGALMSQRPSNIGDQGASNANKLIAMGAPQIAGSWRRAFAELVKGKLADEKHARRRAFNTSHTVELTEQDQSEPLPTCHSAPGGISHHDLPQPQTSYTPTVIILPRIVRNFTQGKITVETCDFFLEILSGWYLTQLHEIYAKNENVVFAVHHEGANRQSVKVSRDFERLEENLNVFIHHMHEKYQEEKYTSRAEASRQKLAMLNKQDELDSAGEVISSDLSSLSDAEGEDSDDDKGMAERLFNLPASLKKEDNRLPQLPQTGQPDTLRHQRLATTTRKQVAEEKAQWSELIDAYKEINKRKTAIIRYQDATRKPGKEEMHPSKIEDREERALEYWRWAFNKVSNRERNKAKVDLGKADLNQAIDNDLEESFDSGFSSDYASQNDTKDKTESVGVAQQQPHEGGSQSSSRQYQAVADQIITKQPSRRRLFEQLTHQRSNIVQMNFARHSMREPKRAAALNHASTSAQKTQSKLPMIFSRQTSRMTLYEQRRASLKIGSHTNNMNQSGVFNSSRQSSHYVPQLELTQDEQTLTYFLINLILFKQLNVANQLINKHFVKMKQCSDLFKANLRRLQALALGSIYLKHDRHSASSEEFQVKSDRCLKRAEKYFKRAPSCAWGLGLTYFQQALTLIDRIYEKKTSDPVPSHFRSKSSLSSPLLQRFDSVGTSFNEKLAMSAKTLLEKACREFAKVNHWRGLYSAYRHLEQLGNRSLFSSQASLSSVEVDWITPDNMLSYQESYKKYLDYYDLQRYSDPGVADLTIQRSGGDDISLLTEIVTFKRNKKLFGDPSEAANPVSPVGSPTKSDWFKQQTGGTLSPPVFFREDGGEADKESSSRLSQVIENPSELNSRRSESRMPAIHLLKSDLSQSDRTGLEVESDSQLEFEQSVDADDQFALMPEPALPLLNSQSEVASAVPTRQKSHQGFHQPKRFQSMIATAASLANPELLKARLAASSASSTQSKEKGLNQQQSSSNHWTHSRAQSFTADSAKVSLQSSSAIQVQQRSTSGKQNGAQTRSQNRQKEY